VVLRHGETIDADGQTVLTQRGELFVQTDSKTAQLIMHLLGPTAPRLADQCVRQLQCFFAALATYVERHPERAAALLANRPASNAALEPSTP
jgi:hypothetical protein